MGHIVGRSRVLILLVAVGLSAVLLAITSSRTASSQEPPQLAEACARGPVPPQVAPPPSASMRRAAPAKPRVSSARVEVPPDSEIRRVQQEVIETPCGNKPVTSVTLDNDDKLHLPPGANRVTHRRSGDRAVVEATYS